MGSSELEAWPQREKGVVFGKRGKGLQGENRVLGMCSSWSGERNNQERKRQREPGSQERDANADALVAAGKMMCGQRNCI